MIAKIRKFFSFLRNKKTFWAFLAALAVVTFVYVYKINSLPPTDNSIENPINLGILSLSEIRSDITFAPQKAADYLLLKIGEPTIAFFRVVSVMAVLLAIVLFYLLMREWISRRVAILTTLLFATSTWVIYDARTAAPDAMILLALPTLLLAGTLLKVKEYDRFLPLTTLLAIAALYVPGLWIFVLVGTIICFKDLKDGWSEVSIKSKTLWATAFALPLLPLIYGLLQPGTFKNWLGISGLSGREFLNNLADLPEQLFISGPGNAFEWLPGTPVLEIVTTVFLALGAAYVVRDKRYPVRRWVLLTFSVLAILAVGLFGYSYIGLLLPLLYLLVGFGITFLLEQWFHIFPRNPVARSTGVVIITLLVVMTSAYHIARYHYVWPRSHEFQSSVNQQ